MAREIPTVEAVYQETVACFIVAPEGWMVGCNEGPVAAGVTYDVMQDCLVGP